jgi:CheY-specific phosphatase CheX
VPIKRDDVVQLASQIWETILGRPLEPDVNPPVGARPVAQVACVQITGGWCGAVIIDCDPALAREAAAKMFGMAPEKAAPGDMQDAVAEIVNMMGGHVKALFPEACALSLPTVINGGDFTARFPGGRVLFTVPLRHDALTLSITLLERIQPAAIAA